MRIQRNGSPPADETGQEMLARNADVESLTKCRARASAAHDNRPSGNLKRPGAVCSLFVVCVY